MTPEIASAAPRQDGPSEIDNLRQELDVANKALVEAHKMASLGRLSAGIVHEINTPIGSIFSNNEVIIRSLERLKQLLAQALKDSAAPPAKALDIVETIASLAAVDKIACDRISSVIRSLKTFARVNDSDIQQVDINELLRNTIKLTSTVFRQRITITTQFGDLPNVECFPGLLNQVFLNLLVNAGQAIANEGTISVGTEAEAQQVHIWVSDTGSGIPAAVRPKIFAVGFTTKPLGEGTGLGLTITREIVEDTHGGKIDFETEVGRGTTFHVRIPMEQPRKSEQ